MCSCGYIETGHKPCVWNGSYYYGFFDIHVHAIRCSVCDESIRYKYYYLNELYESEKGEFEETNNVDNENNIRRCRLANGEPIVCGGYRKMC